MILTQLEFLKFQKIILEQTGISISNSKQALVKSRLHSRVLHHRSQTYMQYLNILNDNTQELKHLINLITTNETYFFREQIHFDFITNLVKQYNSSQVFRVWSAASSVGAEAFSCAMVLDNYLKAKQWEIVATDINTDVIKKAKVGLYCETWIDKIPNNFKKKFCLKGKGRYQGRFIIDRRLLDNIIFKTHNLMVSNKTIGKFDVIFLRNVLIYFNKKIKQQVLNNIILNLKVGGYLIISLTENLDGLNINNLKKIQSSIYKKVK